MNWKEKFEQELAKFQKGDDAVAFTIDFISREIIEKLINEVQFKLTHDELFQLRDKWL